MLISELIKELQTYKDKYGDIDVLIENEDVYGINNVYFENSASDYPKEYNLPENGYILIRAWY